MELRRGMRRFPGLALAGVSLLALAPAGCVIYNGPRSNFIAPKGALYVTCPDADGRVEVGGSVGFREYKPRSAGYEIENKGSKAIVRGSFQPGSPFKDRIPARVNDKIRVTIRDDRGKSKSRTLKVPAVSRSHE